MVFQRVGLSWIIQSNQKPNFDLQHQCTFLILNIPWYNPAICSRWHGLSFAYYVKTSRKCRYNLICSIEFHCRVHSTINDDSSSGGDIPMPYHSTKDALLQEGWCSMYPSTEPRMFHFCAARAFKFGTYVIFQKKTCHKRNYKQNICAISLPESLSVQSCLCK